MQMKLKFIWEKFFSDINNQRHAFKLHNYVEMGTIHYELSDDNSTHVLLEEKNKTFQLPTNEKELQNENFLFSLMIRKRYTNSLDRLKRKRC